MLIYKRLLMSENSSCVKKTRCFCMNFEKGQGIRIGEKCQMHQAYFFT